MEIRAVIIDDEEGAREALANILERFFPDVTVLGKADSAASGFDLINEHQPDLVFLDVEMPNENAFDLIEKFDKINFNVIFVTAYDHYAVQAIKASCLDYLLKPIDLDELRAALEKHSEQTAEQMNFLVESIKSNSLNKIAIPESDGVLFVNIVDIIRCESNGNYTSIFLKNGDKITSSKTLGDYDSVLTEHEFFRTHRSHLINLKEIHKYVKLDGGYILMTDRSEVEVSRRKKQEFLEKIGQ